MCGCSNDNLEKSVIPRLKTNPKYKDAPRYNMIYDYEGEMKLNYRKSVKVMATELAVSMVKILKDN